MNITGHNSYSGCRFYEIQGIYSQKHKHVYFPTNSKAKYTKKNHTDWLLHINELEVALTSKNKEILIKKYGNYK